MFRHFSKCRVKIFHHTINYEFAITVNCYPLQTLQTLQTIFYTIPLRDIFKKT
jgi:hypothetical protein